MRIERASSWADAVFHVCAHVDVPGPESCFSRAYCAWAAERLGPAGARPLAEDARVLARIGDLARAQAVAWVFRSDEAVRAARDQDLREAIVDDEAARAIALAAGPAAEILRAAAELEMPRLEALPPLEWPALADLTSVAPALGACEIALTPALGLRGRVHNTRIFVGVPGLAGATAEHVAWQAAHEATVHEVSAAARLDYADLERRALGRLRSRARRAGLGDAHARWLAHLDLRALGPIPDVDDPT